MGLKTRTTEATYVRIKNGKFFLSSDKEFENPYDEIEGTVKDIFIKNDVFNGKPLEKVYVALHDGDTKYLVSFPFDSSYNTSFLSFIKNANLDRPVSLFLKQTDIKDSDSKRTTFLISQDGTFLKAFYTKDNPNGLPPMVQRRSGKWDKEDMMEFLREVIENELKPYLNSKQPLIQHEEGVEPKTSNELPWEASTVDDNDDDLPF
jgi:hypothetical protein